MLKVAPASDPQWDDAQFRTTKFRSMVTVHGLTLKQVAEITGRNYATVRGWHAGKTHSIPTPELRAFLYDLAARTEQERAAK